MRQCANFAPGPRAPEPEVRSPKHTAYGDTGDGERTGGFQISNSKFQTPKFGVWSLEFGIRHPPGLELGAWSVLRSS